MGWTSKSEALPVTWELIYYYYSKKLNGSGGIRTHASEETGASALDRSATLPYIPYPAT